MKKFDAFLYLSSVSAGVGMIAANLLDVYDVSDYQPNMFSLTSAVVAPAPAVVAAVTVPEVVCKNCRSQPENTSAPEMAAAKSAGKVLSGKDLATGAAQVVPVSGLQR